MVSAYAVAIDAARETLTRRARHYKWLVMSVSLGSLVSLAAALATRSVLPLLALLLLPALVSAHFAFDLSLVLRWRRELLVAWKEDALQLDLLAATVQKVPTLPALTVAGMLETLPSWPGASVPMLARPALFQVQQLVASLAVQGLILRALAWAFVALAAMAVVHGGAIFLIGLLAPPVLHLGWRLACRWRVWRLCADPSWLASLMGTATIATEVEMWLKGLNWQGVPFAARVAKQLHEGVLRRHPPASPLAEQG